MNAREKRGIIDLVIDRLESVVDVDAREGEDFTTDMVNICLDTLQKVRRNLGIQSRDLTPTKQQSLGRGSDFYATTSMAENSLEREVSPADTLLGRSFSGM